MSTAMSTAAASAVAGASLEALLDEIQFRRKREQRRNGEIGGGFSVNHNTTYWTDLFVRHFLFQTEYEVDRDDLLFFIRKNLPGGRPDQFSVEVFRRDSRKLPIGDPGNSCTLEILLYFTRKVAASR